MSNLSSEEVADKWACAYCTTDIGHEGGDHRCPVANAEIERLTAENAELRDRLIAIGQKLHGTY